MKRILLWAAITAILTIGFGCSRTAAPENTPAEHSNGAANAANSNSIDGPDDPNIAPQPGNLNDRDRRKYRVDANPNAKLEPLEFRPAPENSESATTMGADGSIVEIRVFKKHPYLDKVEMSWADPNDKGLKVYLKNGKVVEVKTDKITNLRTAPSIQIMEAAGIRSTPKTADPSRLVDRQ